jgi:hypothetical protein
VSVPVREPPPPLFFLTLYFTVPLPVPDAPESIVIQLSFSDAVQPHEPAAVTVTVPLPPSFGNDADMGEMEKVQTNASCVTVNVCPPIVSVPVRDDPLLAAIVKLTVPLPLPVGPAVIVSQLTPGAAVHAQPLPAVTVTDPVPPLATTD